MKKKICIVLSHMNVGGVEKSLLSLVSTIDKQSYDITIYLANKTGEFLKYIPNYVNIKEIKFRKIAQEYPKLGYKKLFLNLLKRYKFKESYFLTKGIVNSVLFRNDKSMKKFLFGNIDIDEEYDVVINYSGPVHTNSIFVEEILKSRLKFIWIHNEFKKANKNPKKYVKRYEKYDRIIGVSEKCVQEFKELIPSLSDRASVMYNIISTKIIKDMEKHGEGFSDGFEGLRILTVGRLSKQKGYDLAIKVLKRLIDEGYNVKWYVIGSGEEEENLLKLIEDFNVKQKFILLGSNSNPYKYISQCDIYVQPSRFEGYAITLAEARTFNKPILTTKFSGAEEQIKNGETGIIVNFNEIEVYNAIKKLIDNEELRIKLNMNLSKESADSTNEINKLYKYIEL